MFESSLHKISEAYSRMYSENLASANSNVRNQSARTTVSNISDLQTRALILHDQLTDYTNYKNLKSQIESSIKNGDDGTLYDENGNGRTLEQQLKALEDSRNTIGRVEGYNIPTSNGKIANLTYERIKDDATFNRLSAEYKSIENAISYGNIPMDEMFVDESFFDGVNLTEEECETEYGFDIRCLDSLKSFKKRIEYCRRFLKFLGRGSSRIVFLMPNGHALKMAWNKKGLAQNEAEEGDYYLDTLDCFAKTFNTSEDHTWIETELARKCSESEFERLNGFSFKNMVDVIILMSRDRGNGREYQWHHFIDKDKARSLIDKSWDDGEGLLYDINEYIGNYGASNVSADFLRIANWGIVNRNGSDSL